MLATSRIAERVVGVYTADAMSQPARDPIVFVLRHTHWDREWYHPAVVFRKRLVDLVDGILGETPNAPFLLDGQAIVLRDYVALRPERAAELAAALQSGHLEAGPWFVLPDELIPSGEAITRNLLAGRRVLREFRSTPPNVLYSPDSFGHPAALPAIAAGFGYPTIILWRGYGSRRFPRGDAALWRAASGESVLLFHLPPDGYEFGSNLSAQATAAHKRWAAMRAVLEKRSTLGVWLVPNGADHHAPQLAGERALAELRSAAHPIPVKVAGLGELGGLLQQRAPTDLPVIEGELRDSYGYTWTLSGTLATRAYQKRRNAQLERLLIRDAEPWSALARLLGRNSQRQHLQHAWETLLACHPHDSLCGCSIDAVARSVDQRTDDVAAVVKELQSSALTALIGHDPDHARAVQVGANHSTWLPAVIVRNCVPRPRGGVAELNVEVLVAHVPVGPGSAGKRTTLKPLADFPLPKQLIKVERRYTRVEAARFYPINYESEQRKMLAWVPAVAAYGTVAIPLSEQADRQQLHAGDEVKTDTRSVRSALGDLTVSAKGPQWRAQGTKTSRLLIGFETAIDRGDTYTPSIRGKVVRAKAARSRVSLRGPLRGALDSTWAFAGAQIDIVSRIALDAGAPFVRVSVHGNNGAIDQRLRILLHAGLKPRRVLADAAFGLVERKRLRVPAADRRMEMPPTTAPLHRFVTLFDGRRGCTLISDGLAEYEVLDDGTVAITLVRAVAELSRNDIPERPGHAGWPAATPEAQCLGPFAAEFAMCWHEGDSLATRGHILDVVDDVLHPLTGETLHDLVRLPEPTVGIALEGKGLVFSTLKESDDGQYVVARCVNVTDCEVIGAWVLPQPVKDVQMGRLDETPLAPLGVDGNRIWLVVPPFGIHTTLIPLDGNR